jgi:hypothetical protein
MKGVIGSRYTGLWWQWEKRNGPEKALIARPPLSFSNPPISLCSSPPRRHLPQSAAIATILHRAGRQSRWSTGTPARQPQRLTLS